MSNIDINSAAYRRELRKKRILENAELRKQKIFGLNSLNNVQKVQNNDLECETNQVPSLNHKLERDLETSKLIIEDGEKDETSSTKSFESQVSSKSHNQDSDSLSSKDAKLVNDIMKNMPDPLYEYLAENIPCEAHLIQPNDERNETDHVGLSTPNNSEYLNSTFSSSSPRNGSSLLSNTYDKSSTTTTPPCLLFNILEHPASICVLSVIICLLISMNLGSLVSNSLVIPFILWEIQQVIASYSIAEAKEENKSLFNAMLLLCGVQKSIIGKYIWVIKLIRDILQDFTLYFMISVLWQTIIGFPSGPVA